MSNDLHIPDAALDEFVGWFGPEETDPPSAADLRRFAAPVVAAELRRRADSLVSTANLRRDQAVQSALREVAAGMYRDADELDGGV
jgi:hypothetical protein